MLIISSLKKIVIVHPVPASYTKDQEQDVELLDLFLKVFVF